MQVFLIAAMSIDGFIARGDGSAGIDWTSPEDSQRYQSLTQQAGVLVMGSATFKQINRSLPGRRVIVYTSHPELIGSFENVETTDQAPAELLQRLEAQGCQQIALCGGSQIYRLFMTADVVDEMYITVEPVIFGEGIKLFDAALERRFQLIDSEKLNDNTLFLRYRSI